MVALNMSFCLWSAAVRTTCGMLSSLTVAIVLQDNLQMLGDSLNIEAEYPVRSDRREELRRGVSKAPFMLRTNTSLR